MQGHIISGKNLNLYLSVNGYNEPVAHSTTCKITITADTQETTTKNGLKGKTFDYSGKYTYTLSAEGITNFIDIANIGIMQDAIMQSIKLPFIFTDSDNIEWSGTVLITQNDVDSNINNISTFTNAMLGDGELTKVDINVIPPPLGATVNIIDQLGDLVANVPAPGTYQVLRFDNIDCGDAFTTTVPIIIIPAA